MLDTFQYHYLFLCAGNMPPKKEAAPEPKPLIGRVGTNLKVGIVGLPNVGEFSYDLFMEYDFMFSFHLGKSTFFNILTKSAAPAENFPFCTIDPNENKCQILIFYL